MQQYAIWGLKEAREERERRKRERERSEKTVVAVGRCYVLLYEGKALLLESGALSFPCNQKAG